MTEAKEAAILADKRAEVTDRLLNANKGRIAALEARIEALEARIEALRDERPITFPDTVIGHTSAGKPVR